MAKICPDSRSPKAARLPPLDRPTNADSPSNFEQMVEAVEGATAIRVSTKGLWSDDSFGSRMSRVIQGGVTVINGPRPPLINRLLSTMQTCSPAVLLLLALGVFGSAALLIAAILHAAECSDESFGRLFCMTALQLAGGGQAYLDVEVAHIGCMWVATGAEYLVLGLHSSVIGLVVAMILKPSASLVFSETLAIIQRDHKPTVSFRVSHPQGHYVSAFTVKAVWIRPHVTLEGEQKKALTELALNDFRDELEVPVDISHTCCMEQDSPLAVKLAEVGGSWGKMPGFFAITCGGYDEVLQIAVSGVYWYELKKAKAGRSWKEVIVKSKISAVQDGGMPIVNLQALHGVNTWFGNDTLDQ